VNLAHLHLLLNHFPIIGTIIGLGLYVVSLVGKNEGFKRAALIVFAFMALISLPTFFSGAGAQGAIDGQPGVSRALMSRHEGAAIFAMFFMELMGAFALVALWQMHRNSVPARWTVVAILILSFVTVGLMTRVGTTGGDIRHPEIADNPDPGAREGTFGSILQGFEPTPLKMTRLMTANKFWWAFIMDLHFIGLAMIVGALGFIDIRTLGFAKRIPLAALEQLIPWGLTGVALNVSTGVLAYMGMPGYYSHDIAFWFKIFGLVLLGLNAAAFYLTPTFHSARSVGAGEDAPAAAKILAASSLVLWFGVITLGRYIQFYQDTIPIK